MRKVILSIIVTLFLVKQGTTQVVQLWGNDLSGTVFSVNSDGSNFKTVIAFDDTDGNLPFNSLFEASNGKIYGVASGGGTHNWGTLYGIDPVTDSFSVIYNFTDGSLGAIPENNLMQANNGLIYSMTAIGGDSDIGDIFSYNIVTKQLLNVYSFSLCDSGCEPSGENLMQVSNGKLYGMADYGKYCPLYGNNYNYGGVIFSFNITGGVYTDLYNFDCGNDSDGTIPYGSLVEYPGGKLYGTSGGGITGNGVIFCFDTSNNTCKTAYAFPSAIGVAPGQLVPYDGKYYSICIEGGYGAGTIFSFDPLTDSVDCLFKFYGGSGEYPSGLLLASNGIFYGTTTSGGQYQFGNIFSYNPENYSFKVIYSFKSDSFGGGNGLIEYNPNTGIKQVAANNNQLSIYPNPTNGIFTIKSTKNIDALKVTNLLGQIIYAAQPKQTQFTFNISATGMYFVTVTSDNETETKKVVVVK